MRWFVLPAVFSLLASTVIADTPRTMLVTDDSPAGQWGLEGGVLAEFSRAGGNAGVYSFTPYARLGLSKGVTIVVDAPYIVLSSAEVSDSGFGDVRAGVHVLANDVDSRCAVSWIGGADLPTGDAAKGFGRGYGSYFMGLCLGVKLSADLRGLVDGRYVIMERGDDGFAGGVALVEEMSDTLDMSLEAFGRTTSDNPVGVVPLSVRYGMRHRDLLDLDFLVFAWSIGADFKDDDVSIAGGARLGLEF